MFRRAASYLALTVLLAAGNLGTATENHQAVARDESLAGKTPAVFENDLGRHHHHRALNAMTPFWTQIGQTIESIQEDSDFGYAVDISDNGKVIVASAPWHDDGNATDGGLIQVYGQWFNKITKRTVWRKKGPAIISEEDYYHFGEGAKISGDGKVLAIGSDDSNDDAGHIQTYKWAKKGKQWKPMGEPIIGTNPGDEFGWSIDLSEDGMTMVAGSSEHNATGEENGKTEIFTYMPTEKKWVLKGNPILGIHNNTGSDKARYGFAVAIDAVGDRVLTAGLWDGSGDDGAVKVYDYDASADDWVQVGRTLHAVGGDTSDEYYDEFGESVAMSKDGNTIAIGAGCYYYCEEESEDYVHVYRWSDELEDWDLIGDITSSDDKHIGFGMKVSLSADGKRLGLATAGDQRNLQYYNHGYARVYQYNGTMDWSPLGQDLVIEGQYRGGYGTFLSLSGDGMHLVVGAPSAGFEEGVDENAGEVKAYELADDDTTSPVAGCVNADKKIRFKLGKKFKTCKFVGKKKARWCQNAAVASMCPAHCGKCFESACEDGPLAWKFKKSQVDCEWVAGLRRRCFPSEATVCRKTCDSRMYNTFCRDKTTPAPKLPLNSTPSSTPTSA